MRNIGAISLLTVLLMVPYSYVYAASSCQTPIAYSIDTIDSRFNMSKYDLVQDLQFAEKAWEGPTQKDLFTYVAMGGVKVSLVYDSRQAETDKEKATIAKLLLIKSTFDILHERFTIEASSTEARETKNSVDFTSYRSDETGYNADVAAVNARGGASDTELREFTNRESDLRSRFAILKAEQDSIHQYIDRMNILSDLLNQLAVSVNAYINRYDASLAARGEHEAGVYTQNRASRKITVYEFADTNRLIRTLAHELGHALGLEHVAGDKEAIMYASNIGGELTATAADISQLDSICAS